MPSTKQPETELRKNIFEILFGDYSYLLFYKIVEETGTGGNLCCEEMFSLLVFG